MSRVSVFFGLLIASIHFSFGQVPISGDYIVTQQGDTLYGFIQSVSESKISLANTSENSMVVKKYRVSDLNCIVIKDTVYRAVNVQMGKGSTTYYMMKEVIDGPISLLHREIRKTKLWKPNEEQDFSGIVGKVLYTDVYLKKEDLVVKVDPENFLEASKILIADQSWILKKFEDGVYSFKNHKQMVLDYNYLVLNPDSN